MYRAAASAPARIAPVSARAQVVARFGVPLLALLTVALAAGVGAAVGLGASPIYALAGTAALAFLVFSLLEPQLAVLATVTLGIGRIWDVATNLHGAPPVAMGLLALLFALLAWRVFKTQGRGLVTTTTAGLILLYPAVLSLAALFAHDVNVALDVVSDTARDLLLLLLVANLLTTRSWLRWTIWAVVGLGALLSALAVYQGLTGNFSQTFFGVAQAERMQIIDVVNRPRVSGPFGDPNVFAQYLLVFAALALFRAMDERSLLLRLAGLAALGLNLAALLYTFSRGAIIALALTVLVVCVLRRISLKTLLVMAALGTALVLAAPDNFTSRLTTLSSFLPGEGAENPVQEISFRGRLSENLAGVLMFFDYPVLGAGPGNYPGLYQQYAADIGLEYRSTERTTHNLFLQLAAETGALGLGLFLSIVAAVVRDLRRAAELFRRVGDALSASLADSLLLALAAFLSAGLFLSLDYPRGLWLLVALAVAARRIAGEAIARGASPAAVAVPGDGRPSAALPSRRLAS